MQIGMSLLTLVPQRMGGSESYVRALLGEFRHRSGPEHVTVLANGAVTAEYALYGGDGVTIHPIRGYGGRPSASGRVAELVGAYALPRRLSKQVPGDLDLMHYPVSIPIPKAGVPHVVTIHDVQHHDLPGFFSHAERTMRHVTYDSAARNAALVITPSQYSAGRLTEALGVPAERIRAIRNGIDHERFSPEPGARDLTVRESLDLTRPFLLYPANLWPHKNHRRLIEGFAAAGESEVDLVLTGRTYGRLDDLLTLARTNGVEGRVRHLGFVAADDMPALYRLARGVVFPSLYEGFGGPPLEAMACGCPVAASRRAALAEVCGDAAIELDPESVDSIASRVLALVTDEDLRRQARRAGLDRARLFSWPASAEAHLAAYRAALG